MKYVATVLTVIVLSAGVTRADESKPMTSSGNFAWLFGFSGLSSMQANGLFSVGAPYTFSPSFTTDVASGSVPTFSTAVPAVGLRWYLANNVALSGGLGFGTFSFDQKPPTGSTGLSDSTNSGLAFGIRAQIEWHMNPIGAVSPYFGGGLGVTIASATDKAMVASSPATGTPTEVDASSTQFGVFGVVGFEWFFTNAMSLGAQYQLGLTLTSGTTTSKATGASDVTGNFPSYMNLSTNAFSVILSMYIK